MATEQYVYDRSYKAETDLSAKQHYIVELSGSDQVDVCDNAGDKPFGVLQNDPAAGQEATVRHLGVSKVVSDGSGTAIVAGDWVGTGATGKAIKKAANNDLVLGQALDASSADGVVIRVFMTGVFSLGA